MGMAEIAVETRAEGTGRRSRGRRVLLLAVVAGALICGGWKMVGTPALSAGHGRNQAGDPGRSPRPRRAEAGGAFGMEARLG